MTVFFIIMPILPGRMVSDKDRQFVSALARGLDVLRAFQAGDGLLGNQEIAARTRLPKPTVSRLTHTLTCLGYLHYAERFGKYRLTPAVLSLGYAALAGLDIRGVARPLMQAMAEDCGVSVSLGSRDGDEMVYIETCRGSSPLMMRMDVGARIPLATTAMGRACLAAMPADRRQQVISGLATRWSGAWPAVKAGIDAAVTDYAWHGYTRSLGDWRPEIHAVGTALWSPDGETMIGLNCGGATSQMPPDQIDDIFGPRLLKLARDIEAALGRPKPGEAR